MRFFSYRNKLRFLRFAAITGSILAVTAILVIGVIAYLDRYIVYDHNGANLDVNWKEHSAANGAVKHSDINAEIAYVDSGDDVAIGSTRKVSGYYITSEMLKDIPSVQETLSSGAFYAVMIDVKDIYGFFYYPSGVSEARTASSVDVHAVAELIQTLDDAGAYLIARIPAFADQRYCLNHVELGLPLSSGALWADDDNCYWMDPGDPAVINYLETICTELQTLGFREVVLDGFRFPDTEAIVYDESERSREDVLIEAATVLQADMSMMDLKISFGLDNEQVLPMPLTEGRLYFEMDDGASIHSLVARQEAYVVTPDVQIVFLAESRDTRFEEYGHLSPAIQSALPAMEDDE